MVKDLESKAKTDVWISELSRDLTLASPALNDGLLVSAYDVFHGHLKGADQYLGFPEILFVDSGGYELGFDEDLSALRSEPYKPREWNRSLLDSTLKEMTERYLNDMAVVSLDLEVRGKPLHEQVESAKELFEELPEVLHDFLIKPTTKDQKYLPIRDNIAPLAHHLRGFSILGVTEIELGNSLLDRVRELARLRIALDNAGVTSPIHVFGSLDPLLTTLYFLAGAEIFDGLSWLRYGYRDGLAIYYQHFNALAPGIQRSRDQARAQMLMHNLTELDQLRMSMHTFLEGNDFSVFGSQALHLKQWYDHLCGQVPGVR